MADVIEQEDPDTSNPATAPDPEPEGVVELQGQRVVPLSALTSERERVRTRTEEKLRAEHEPVKQRAALADRLEAELEQLRPQLDFLRQHPEVMQQQPQAPAVPEVSDEEAEKTARDYELYTPTGLDLARAKRIISKNKAEITQAAQEAAHAAVQPMLQTSAVAAARQNFVWAASQKDAHGNPLVDPQELAAVWVDFPAELTANPDVARTVLEAAIGRSVRGGKRPQRSEQEPVFSEASGGLRPKAAYQVSQAEQRLAKSVGLSEKQWSESAQKYQPDATNILGD